MWRRNSKARRFGWSSLLGVLLCLATVSGGSATVAGGAALVASSTALPNVIARRSIDSPPWVASPLELKHSKGTVEDLVVALVRAAKDHDACKTWHVNESFVSLQRAKEMQYDAASALGLPPKNRESMRTGVGEFRTEVLPGQASFALERMTCAIAAAESGGKPVMTPPRLLCPSHERRFGYRLALLLQTVRARMLLVANVCKGAALIHVLNTSARFYVGNTPGSALKQRMFLRRAVLEGTVIQQTTAPRRPVVMDYELGVRYVGQSFWEALLGLSLHEPCEDEIVALCGHLDNGPRPVVSFYQAAGIPAPYKISVPPDVSTSLRASALDLWVNNSTIHSVIPEGPLSSSTIQFIRQQYKFMRRLLPLSLPDDRASAKQSWRCQAHSAIPVAMVVVHIRAGSGTRSLEETFFWPLLRWLRSALQKRVVGMRVHVFHELNRTDLCCEKFEGLVALQRSRQNEISPSRTRPAFCPGAEEPGGMGQLFIHTDPNRMTMMHSLLQADILLAGDSIFPTLAAHLTERAFMAVVHTTQAKGFGGSVTPNIPGSVVLPYWPCQDDDGRVAMMMRRGNRSKTPLTAKDCTAVLGVNVSRATEMLNSGVHLLKTRRWEPATTLSAAAGDDAGATGVGAADAQGGGADARWGGPP